MILKQVGARFSRISYSAFSKGHEFSFKEFFTSNSHYCEKQIRPYRIFQKSAFQYDKMTILSNAIRFKSKKTKQSRIERDEDTDDENEDAEDECDEENKLLGVEVKQYSLQNLRVDLIIKTALGYQKKFIEECFYQNKLRINGSKVSKKGTNVKIGDQIDLVKDLSPHNENFLVIDRVEILNISVNADKDCFIIKLRKLKSLTIEKYDNGKI